MLFSIILDFVALKSCEEHVVVFSLALIGRLVIVACFVYSSACVYLARHNNFIFIYSLFSIGLQVLCYNTN